MADLKISQLPAASTPLAGTEVLPVVQGGVTEQVSVADLTAGRAVAATSLTVGAGAVGTPSVTTTGDLNTGIFFPAADTVAIAEGGVEALRINASGEVIVGNGDAVASPASATIRGTDGSGTNIAGGTVTIQAGRGTGTGAGGSISFATSPAGTSGSTLQTATERMKIDSAGNVGIGTAPTNARVTAGGTLTVLSANSSVFNVSPTVPSTSTNSFISFNSKPTTEAASFTVNNSYGFRAASVIMGAGSALTNYYGFTAESDLTMAATNYGFVSGIPSGAARFNFYASGTADNYFAGKLYMADLILHKQSTPTSKSSAATLTGAELITGILQYTGAAATITLPTGANIEGAFTWYTGDVAFDWYVINTGSGTCTIGANGNTTVGTLTVTAGTSAHFSVRRVTTNSFTIYRL